MVGRLIRFFTENWALKLAAVGLAILLWLAVRADAPKQAVFRNIPVEVDLRDPDWRLEGEPDPSTVNVTVVGSTPELMELYFTGIARSMGISLGNGSLRSVRSR